MLSKPLQNIKKTIEDIAKEDGTYPQGVSRARFREYTKENDLVVMDVEKLGGFSVVKDACFPPLADQMSITKLRTSEHAKNNRKLQTSACQQRFILEEIENLASRIFKGKISASPSRYKKTNRPKRILNLVLSDLHIGSDVLAEETGKYDFGKVEEARRLAAVVKQVAEYKLHYRKETKLNIFLIGDIIENLMHTQFDGALLSEQIARAIHLLIQVIGYLSKAFPSIDILCLSGNHGRIPSKHHGRAVNQKFDSLETVIYSAVKYACVNLKNVTFIIPKSPYYVVDLFGHKAFITHGDGTLNVGNPSKVISISSLENQANKISASLSEMSLFIAGHIHRYCINALDNGATLITNASLKPTDPYAISIGSFNNQCGQALFESVPDFPLGDSRLIRVGIKQDKDKSLDQIIQPWVNY